MSRNCNSYSCSGAHAWLTVRPAVVVLAEVVLAEVADIMVVVLVAIVILEIPMQVVEVDQDILMDQLLW